MKKEIALLFLAAAAFLVSCSGDNRIPESAALSGDRAEEAVPVKVKDLQRETFIQYQTYTAVLHGSREAAQTSSLNGIIENVYYDVGSYVEKDQVILSFPKDTSSAQYFQSRASYEAAEKTYSRMKNLFESNGISRQDYDQAKTQYEVQRANWNAVSDMVEVKSPVSGYLTQLSVDPSDSVSQGDTLFTVSDYRTLIATVSIPDRGIGALETDLEAEATWEGHKIEGKVIRVNLSKDSRSKAFTAQLAFSNPGFLIPSGVTAKIRIDTFRDDNAIVLHKDEFLIDKSGAYAYVVNNDRVEKRELLLGLNQGFYYEIQSGLHESDLIITEGLTLIDDNSKVLVIDSGAKS